ncbi:PAAR domain-containing protein [Pseudovibrio brasiliensis]|jgi:uncharacterized Zn-binding protein involved in type VI secretion|uniref:PAAR domain-containing protein n=1 Tax=Pseudovibrio brasiliensis TaxID=1898042 RepID=A0ABX8AY85_9HYPH|nr:PAAR domain-containing protein [Pseudovibrio brasiliensis]QUS59147.1 PAAR domain-containing protein [Pseudovibrio brasiliensis]
MSGKPAARLGDIGSGHGCHFPPTPAIAGSPNILINNRLAVRQGDAYAPHPCPVCPSPPHGRSLASGSPTVLFNNKQAGRQGDPIDCGGADSTGSGDVLIGGASPPGMSRSPFCETCEDKASKG